MKIERITKENVTATVGTSVELSNTELVSIAEVEFDLNRAISETVKDCRSVVENAEDSNTPIKYSPDEVVCCLKLRTVMRMSYLLGKITTREKSGIFEGIDNDVNNLVAERINNECHLM